MSKLIITRTISLIARNINTNGATVQYKTMDASMGKM